MRGTSPYSIFFFFFFFFSLLSHTRSTAGAAGSSTPLRASSAKAADHQGLGVISLRTIEDRRRRALLHHHAAAQDDDVVGERAHHFQIVADEEKGKLVAHLERAQESTICACTDMSSAHVGSSNTTKRGFRIMARAIAMRCRWPPENSWG